ncbi:MAG: hypothetical protein ACTSWG_13315 [Candidatus Helarchaeota archaeon]
MSKYLEFKQVPFKGKTKLFLVISKSSKDILARIKWYGAWRQYCFYPSEEFITIWNKDCLKDIQNFLQQLMNERNNTNLFNNKENLIGGR